MLRKSMSLLLVLVLFVSALTACTAQTSEQSGAAQESAAAPATQSAAQPAEASGDTIKIGSIHPLTGSMAYEGQQLAYAQQLIIDQINEAGGIKSMGGRKLELVTGDSQASPDIAASEAERLINNGCVALTGCYTSATSMTASQKCEIAEIPFIVTISSSLELMQRGYQWTFRVQPNTEVFCENFIEYLAAIKTDDMQTIAVFYEDSITGYTTAQYVIDNIDRTGLELVGTIPYAANTASLSAEVTKLQDLNPDVLLPISYYQDGSMMFKEFIERNMSFELVIGIVNAAFSDQRFIQEFGDKAKGILNINYQFDATKGTGKELAEQFKAKYDQEILSSSYYGCYSIWVLADALERAGTDESEALRKAIAETNYTDDLMTFKSIEFNDICENANAAGVLIQIQDDGEPQIVFPSEYAQSELLLSSWPVQ